MLSAQGDSRNSKNKKADAQGERRVSWVMILLGLALLIGALLLYLYYSTNTERNKVPANISNINRASPAHGVSLLS